MPDIELVPVSLAKAGVKRLVKSPAPDLRVIMELTPYRVLGNYEELCRLLDIEPYAGGTYKKQGPPGPGYINSGYRAKKPYSAHGYGLAIDPIADLDLQIRMVRMAKKKGLFTRSGIYPNMTIAHLDQMPRIWMEWMKRVKKKTPALYWVCMKINKKKTYTYFNDLEKAIKYAERIG